MPRKSELKNEKLVKKRALLERKLKKNLKQLFSLSKKLNISVEKDRMYLDNLHDATRKVKRTEENKNIKDLIYLILDDCNDIIMYIRTINKYITFRTETVIKKITDKTGENFPNMYERQILRYLQKTDDMKSVATKLMDILIPVSDPTKQKSSEKVEETKETTL